MSYFGALAGYESSGGQVLRNPKSGATGTYQFMPATWNGLVTRYPSAGLTAAGITDPQQQEKAVQLFTQENKAALAKYLGRDPLPWELYAAHRFGATGAQNLLDAAPDTPVSVLYPKAWSDQNPDIRGKTAGEVQALFQHRFSDTKQKYDAALGVFSAKTSGGAPAGQPGNGPAKPPGLLNDASGVAAGGLLGGTEADTLTAAKDVLNQPIDRLQYALAGGAQALAPIAGASRTPIAFGQVLGALGGGLAGGDAAARQAQLSQLEGRLKVGDMEQKLAQRQQMQQFLQGLPADQRMAAMAAPEHFWGQWAKQKFPDKDGSPSAVKEYQVAVQQGYKGSFVDYQKELAAAGRQTLTIQENGENSQSKKIGEGIGDLYVGLVKSASTADGEIARLRQLGNLLDQVGTGRFAGTTTELKRAAKGMGVDLTAMGIRDDVAPAQAAQALSREMALQLRDPSSGAGMPGAMSDSDRKFLESMVPGLETDPEARRMMIEARTRLAQRTKDVARAAMEYRRTKGTLDEGFFLDQQAKADAAPLFADLQERYAKSSGGTPASGGAVSAAGRTPASTPDFGGMSLDELGKLDRTRMSEDELKAASRRYQELTGAGVSGVPGGSVTVPVVRR